jgi:2'-5' RNA ligase
MRCFVAVDMSTPSVRRCLEALRDLGAPLRVVAPENLHVTLKFLGEIRDAQVSEVIEAMDKALEGSAPFEARLRGLGVFPSTRNMRVIWVGVINDEMVRMQRSLDAELARLGFPREKRFHPHLTLARVKSRRGLEKVREFLAQHADEDYGRVMVDRVELKKSVLTPKGPIYSCLFLRRL